MRSLDLVESSWCRPTVGARLLSAKRSTYHNQAKGFMTMHKAMLTMVLSLVCGCGGQSGDLDVSKFIGVWEVDFDRTMEESKKSPKYDEKMAERMPALIKRMMGTMTIRLTDKEMVYRRGTKDIAHPYSVKSSDENSVTITVKQEANEITIAFTLIDGEYMSFKSSASDDMNYYVWKKSAE